MTYLNAPPITYIPAPMSAQDGFRGWTPGAGFFPWGRVPQTAPFENPQGDMRWFDAPPIPQAFPDKHAYDSYVYQGKDRIQPRHSANTRGWSAPGIPTWGTGAGPGC